LPRSTQHPKLLQPPPSPSSGRNRGRRSNTRALLVLPKPVVVSPSSSDRQNSAGLRLQYALTGVHRNPSLTVSLSPLLSFAPLDLDLVLHNRPLIWSSMIWSGPPRSFLI
jgi:hypothetical protein